MVVSEFDSEAISQHCIRAGIGYVRLMPATK